MHVYMYVLEICKVLPLRLLNKGRPLAHAHRPHMQIEEANQC